jgi:uncharacterized BrkB/YihY/UPF0761 family membrane protein
MDDEQRTDEPEAPLSATDRARARAGALQARAAEIAERAQQERSRHRSVDAVFQMADRDAEVGGGIIAGALAYRLFIWLLPLALVLVAGLGIVATEASESPASAAKSAGLAGIVTHSVASAANSSARWYALLIGIPLLLWFTRSVLRTLIVMHRLVWTDVRNLTPKPTVVSTLKLLGLLLCYLLISGLATAARAHSFGVGLLVTVIVLVPYACLWLVVTLLLPHRGAEWYRLLPGALLFAVGAEALQVFTAYYIAPEASSKQGTYGSLGVAAALLLGLYLLGRLVVAAAVLNATLWERRSRPE